MDKKVTHPLHNACYNQDAAAVKQLLTGIKPAALNKKLTDYDDPVQGTPLQIACRNGNSDIVRLLVEAGADKEIKDVGLQTPLMIAATHQHEDIARYLIENGANIQATGAGKRTVLHYASMKSGAAIIDLLIEKGMDVNQLDGGKGSALEYAAGNIGEGGNEAAAAALIKHGINPEHITSAFRWACWRNNPGIAAFFIKNGADYKSETTPRSELLFWICGRGFTEVVKLLLAHEVDFKTKVKFKGKMMSYDGSPLDRAIELNHQEIVTLIKG